ncbi:outer membrane murein-binding lipoprotein Lpp [Microvirga flocculans]|uniref:Outer membrane murein-binding lipoprotein Lpp n=1 Tax=Microvirga flocculans TaxID=217168 RepID=A0A7W6IDG9_9HYPH|nr:hypothetical protein [Microvirga flocculans]MBB4039131.1 outer membrane murein-binding lipoprotein Lpp [Microvirga flocculans]
MLTFRKSYASITKGLKKMVDDLDAFASQKRDEAFAAEDQAKRLRDEVQAAHDEADRALLTARKVATLLS